jgi:flagellar basal-body rod protein FlgB
MWIDRLVDCLTTRAAQLAASFAEARQNVLAQNLANIDTPDYHTRVLDPRQFQKSLAAALERSQESKSDRLDLRGDAQVSTTPAGQIEVRPSVEPAPNILFHDGTNGRLESLIADTHETALYYEMSTNFLRYDYQNLLSAIRGRVA